MPLRRLGKQLIITLIGMVLKAVKTPQLKVLLSIGQPVLDQLLGAPLKPPMWMVTAKILSIYGALIIGCWTSPWIAVKRSTAGSNLRRSSKTDKAGKAIFNKPVHRIHRITISHNAVRSIHSSLIKLQRLLTTSSHLQGRNVRPLD